MEDNELIGQAYRAVSLRKERMGRDPYRLKYHITPPAGFLGDPNGFIFFHNEYHLFYQFNPFYPQKKLIYWAHIKSKDMVHWEDMPIVLAPSSWYDRNGCYSGSAVDDNGVMTLMYTGNVKDGKGERETYQCIAMSKDGINFEKYSGNPVISNQPEGYTRHFRDPKVWRMKDLWYAVIGTQNTSMEGRVVLYKSEDLKRWEMVGEVAGSNRKGLKYLGYMWECPNLINISGRDVLIFCPQGIKAEGDLYNNRYQCGYIAGELDYDTGNLNCSDFVELDSGFEFYAPQVIYGSERNIMIGWMGMPEEEGHPTRDNGWIHAMSIPRELFMQGDKLYQKPLDEFNNLRKSNTLYRNITLNGDLDLESISGRTFEMIISIQPGKSHRVGVSLRHSKARDEETLFYFDSDEKKLVFDRDKSGKGYKGIRKCDLAVSNTLNLHIFCDTSSLEVFVNDGEKVFTGRIYPNEGSNGITFFAYGGEAVIDTVDFYII